MPYRAHAVPIALITLLGFAGFAQNSTAVPSQPFGKTPHGEKVTLYTLTNKNGMSVSIMDYGATIVKIVVPDRNGKLDDVALGFDHFAPYLTQTAYFGATIGRYANRIARGKFEINHTAYQVPVNNGPNSLHGGWRGFDKRIWKVEPVESDSPAIQFTRFSPDGEEGYPGNLFVNVTFTLTDDNQLHISYRATTDKPTVINLTNHTYFNLAGAGNGSILDHVVTLHANAFTPVDATLIPTGEIKDVAGTPWDFRTATPIGLHLRETGGNPIGYDHNYVLTKGFFSNFGLAAEVEDPKSGRILKVYTDQPGVQFYTGNFLDGTLIGKDGKAYRQYDGFCLETQHFPDSPNHANFPSTLLRPGDVFKSTTIYAFDVK
ncbi:MAG: galactose mutarotase [Methylacidiphilales bacterium]|nr:galactose mutarotase [Candidatus Methylacidiphilales bacterium]